MSKRNVLQMVARTNVGRVRDHNEDNFIATGNITNSDWVIPSGNFINPEEGSLMSIADGMGGTNAGEVASAIAIANIRNYLFRQSKQDTGEKDSVMLSDAIQAAHKAIVNHTISFPETHGMGTTLILNWIAKGYLYTAWSGDSRTYLYRPLQGLKQISKDHSYVQQLVDDGKITEEDAFLHPQGNIILQSLGDPDREPKPDLVSTELFKNDIILVCSDGLSGMLTERQIEEIVSSYESDITACADILIDKANEAGGTDNITLILAKVVEGEEPNSRSDMFSEAKQTTVIKSKRTPLVLFITVFLLAGIAVLAWIGFPAKSKNPVVTDSAKQEKPDSNLQLRESGRQQDTPRKESTQPANNKASKEKAGSAAAGVDSKNLEKAAKAIEKKENKTGRKDSANKKPDNDLDLKSDEGNKQKPQPQHTDSTKQN